MNYFFISLSHELVIYHLTYFLSHSLFLYHIKYFFSHKLFLYHINYFFITWPICRSAADYYEAVSSPIDLLKIQNKIKSDEYEDVEQMSSDIQLLVANAKTYYKVWKYSAITYNMV